MNLLLLDEPTDNLDLVSAEALEAALAGFEGTVLAVTHDRWFLRAFDRFVILDDDCSVTEALDRDAALHASPATPPTPPPQPASSPSAPDVAGRAPRRRPRLIGLAVTPPS